MARRIVEVFTCDFCQRPIEDKDKPTVSFSWNGSAYEADLCREDESGALNGAISLAKLIEIARPAPTQTARPAKRTRSRGGTAHGFMERYREGDQYICPGCGNTFGTPSALGVHHRRHGFNLRELEDKNLAEIEARGPGYRAKFKQVDVQVNGVPVSGRDG